MSNQENYATFNSYEIPPYLNEDNFLQELDNKSIKELGYEFKPNDVQFFENTSTALTSKINALPNSEINLNYDKNSFISNNSKDNIKSEIYINNNEINNELKNQKLGRKRKNSNEKGAHNKYSKDNLIKKCKSILLNNLSNFINNYIKKIYKDNNNKKKIKRQLLKLNQEIISDTKNSKELLNKTLKEIFSQDISKKYKKYEKNYNKNLIDDLLNEENEEKRKKFNALFDLSFSKYLNHIRGSKKIDILQGLKSLDIICNKFEGDNEYLGEIKYYINNFVEIISTQRNRKKKFK